METLVPGDRSLLLSHLADYSSSVIEAKSEQECDRLVMWLDYAQVHFTLLSARILHTHTHTHTHQQQPLLGLRHIETSCVKNGWQRQVIHLHHTV